MRIQKWWVPFIVVLAAFQALRLSLKPHRNGNGNGKQFSFVGMFGSQATVSIQFDHTNSSSSSTTHKNSNQQQQPLRRDPYLPLESVMGQPLSWEEPLFSQQGHKRLPLNFLHLPKTGGTSIVVAAANAGYAWGDCMFPLRRETKNCPIENAPVNNNNTHYHPELWIKTNRYVRSWWHVPIQYLPNDAKHPNPYANQDLFIVIRNPYKRILSQYYYRCLRDPGAKCFVDAKGRPIADTPKRMNKIVQKWVRKQQSSKWGGQDYFFHDAHWVPQSHYVYDYSTNKSITMTARPRKVRHVLHFEYLAEHFASLMKAYGLRDVIQLSKDHKVNDRAEYVTHTTAADLTLSSLRLIEEVYKDDFELGGYPMLSMAIEVEK